MVEPLVSVIMPVYNREEYLAESLECLLKQSYTNWECIIVDDGSTDTTLSIIDKYSKKDTRIKSFSRPVTRKKGAACCRNIGFEKSSGEFIQYLDSDDLLSPTKLENQVYALSGLNNFLSFCNWSFFDHSKEMENLVSFPFVRDIYTPLEFLDIFGKYSTYLPVHSYLISRKLIERAGVWNEELTGNDDAEFLVRVLLNAEGLLYVKECEVFYRKNASQSLSNLSDSSKIESIIQSWELIDLNLKEKYPHKQLSYVDKSVERLFRNIKWENSQLAYQYPEFFKRQIKKEKRDNRFKLIRRLYRRIRKRVFSASRIL